MENEKMKTNDYSRIRRVDITLCSDGVNKTVYSVIWNLDVISEQDVIKSIKDKEIFDNKNLIVVPFDVAEKLRSKILFPTNEKKL